MGPVLRADEVGRKRLTLRSMEARRPRKAGALAKKFVAFRFCANALLTWASFPFPDLVGISTNKTEKVGRFYGNPSFTTGRIHYAQGATRYRCWPHCYAGRVRARG